MAVECDLPPGVTAAEFKRWIVEEVKAAFGGLHPDDPRFALDRSTVRGTVIPRDVRWRPRQQRPAPYVEWPPASKWPSGKRLA